MKTGNLEETLTTYLAFLETSIKHSNSLGRTNKNIDAEGLYMDMLNITHGHNLIKASSERVNFAAADLIDRKRRLAVQITSDNNLTKIKDRIDTFNRHDMHKDFDGLTFYIIGKRSSSIKVDQKYEGIYLDTDVIDSKRFIEEVCINKKLQEVCDYLEEEIIPKSRPTEVKQEINHNFLAGADLPHGTTINISSGSQTVNMSPQSFDINNQVMNLQGSADHGVPALGEYSETKLIDSDYDELNYFASKLLEKDLRDVEAFEIGVFYDNLDDLEGTQFNNVAAVLWMLLYYENSVTKRPPDSLKQRAILKKQSLSRSLSAEYQEVLEKFVLYQASSQKLLNSIEYVTKAS